MNSKNHIRAVRYRQLSLAEPDRAKADVLLKIADEAERDVALHRRLDAQRDPANPAEATKLVMMSWGKCRRNQGRLQRVRSENSHRQRARRSESRLRCG